MRPLQRHISEEPATNLDDRGAKAAPPGAGAPAGNRASPPHSSSGAPETLYVQSNINKRALEKLFSGFPPQYNYIYNGLAPDIAPDIVYIRENPEALREFNAYKYALQMRWKHGWRPVLVGISYEPGPPCKLVDFSFHYSPPDEKNCPNFMFGQVDKLLSSESNGLPQQYRKVKKTRFCNFIYRSCARISHLRKDFCQLLAQYKKVDCPAESLNNMPKISWPDNWIQEKLDFMANCKFSICFEQTSSPWYVSEKIYHAFLAGTVPIYWGCPEISQYFNPAAFVNCHDYPSFEAVVEKVREIDASPGLYEKYRNAPPILPESRIYELRRRTEAHRAAIVSEALARRNRKRNRLLVVLRLSIAPGHHIHQWLRYFLSVTPGHRIYQWPRYFRSQIKVWRSR